MMKTAKLSACVAFALAILSTSVGAQERMTYVSPGSSNAQSEKLKFYHWDGGFDDDMWAFAIGYVNKSWICTYDTGNGQGTITQREDFFGDSNDKYFHGIQFGGVFTPSFDWGLGLHTGLFLEIYNSRSRWIREFCNHFSELDMYIPVDAYYRIEFGDNFALNILGGIGFQWAMDGRYSRLVGTTWGGYPYYRPRPVYQQKRHEYGNGWPKRVNWQGEVGMHMQFKQFSIGFTYGFGLVDHGIQKSFDDGATFVTASKSRQDKMEASVAFVF